MEARGTGEPAWEDEPVLQTQSLSMLKVGGEVADEANLCQGETWRLSGLQRRKP